MAHFTFRAHDGLTAGYGGVVRTNAFDLAEQAAKNVSWNRLSAAPEGFTMTQVGTQMQPIHTKTGIKFKAGFLMFKVDDRDQKWEGHATAGGLRLDLQCINSGWANWAVQTNGKNSVTVATCLMKVGETFSQEQLAHGLIQSAERNQLCELSQ